MRPTFRHLLFTVLLALSPYLAADTPRPIAKDAVVEVPEGMKLVRDRTGQRWLLPTEMEAPPERSVDIKYYTAKVTPHALRKIGTHTVLSGPKSALDTIVSSSKNEPKNLMNRLPKALGDLLDLEKGANLHAQNSPDLQSLGVFSPAAFTTFEVPYIPMPEDAFEYAAISSYAHPETRSLVTFVENGKVEHRFFIHPNYVESYSELIAKYGIVYHYHGISSSSPRSLVMIDPDHPEFPYWVKPSLHRKIDGSVRINTDKKARRAILMSEAIQSVPANVLASYGLKFMLEPAAFQPKGKIASTIHREVAPELMVNDPNSKWIPAFILQNTGADAVPGLNLEDMIKASGEAPEKFVRERIVRPLLRSYLSMGILEGLPGELHTQNFYYKVVRQGNVWMPTGELMFKDNDGFRYDTELAMRRGRNLEFFAKFDKPFFWGKFSNTLGLGSEGIPFLGSWYYKLIRNVNGFETLAAYTMRALQKIDVGQTWDNNKVQMMFDDVASSEAEKLTGVKVDRSEYGYGYNKGVNLALNSYRIKMSSIADTADRQDPALQNYLGNEWAHLKGAERVSTLRRALPKDAYYVLHVSPDGESLIEARTPRTTVSNPDPTVGFAMVESVKTAPGASFTEDIKHHQYGKYDFKMTFGGSCADLFSGAK